MELLIPKSFKMFGFEYEAEEVEKSSASIIIDNIINIYGKTNEVTFVFDKNETYTFDNYVYYLKIKYVSFSSFEIAFPVNVIICVSNNSKRKLSDKHTKVVYNTAYNTFRNEAGEVIKYYDYRFE